MEKDKQQALIETLLDTVDTQQIALRCLGEEMQEVIERVKKLEGLN